MLRYFLMIALFVFGSVSLSFGRVPSQNTEEPNTTREVKGLPFGALILREFINEDEPRRVLHILMDPAQISEKKLKLLFGNLSRKFSDQISLDIWVYTDVEQLGILATNSFGDLAPARGAKPKEERPHYNLAYYKRAKDVELFRYNPNYPKFGEKTVILRGRE